MSEAAATATLVAIAGTLGETVDPWWIIAGAAAWLHGAADPPARDIDVLLSRRDAMSLIDRLSLHAVPSTDKHFHSEIFARWNDPPLAVEIMADFKVRIAARWRRIEPTTRQPIQIGGCTIFVPDRPELARILLSFDRAKDRPRIRRLLDQP